MAADVAKMFTARTHHRRIVAATSDSAIGSRMGGRPPAPLAKSAPQCPRCKGPVQYLMTLPADVLGEKVAGGRAVSLLCCRSLECRFAGCGEPNNDTIILSVHEDAPRANGKSVLDTNTDGRKLMVGALTADPVKDGRVQTDRSKVGGGPGFIQGWGGEEAEAASARGAGFLFQWCETGYLWSEETVHQNADMTHAPYPFLGGVVYVFSRIHPSTKVPELTEFSAFWQNT